MSIPALGGHGGEHCFLFLPDFLPIIFFSGFNVISINELVDISCPFFFLLWRVVVNVFINFFLKLTFAEQLYFQNNEMVLPR